MKVLVTGGAGYIGSHTCLELLGAGFEVTVVDNLVNSSQESLRRVEKLAGKSIRFHNADLCDKQAILDVVGSDSFDAVIHFAALKAVGESVAKPLEYYENNLAGTLNLCFAMREHGVKNLVFSSSATVYGIPKTLPLTEDSETPIQEVTNPYGRSKLIMEYILRDWQACDSTTNVALLRYFNPVGAHASGQIGEDPNGIPNNLLPFVSQVAVGKLEKLKVFGGDYETADGTGVRDYIHVVDLAVGHVLAIKKLARNPGVVTYNLGTGQGYSVLEIVKAFEKAAGKPIPYDLVDRRPGDVAACYADPKLAAEELGWTADRGIDEMCADSWNWQSQNPNGFATESTEV
ncbi:UDP-glucose 4-epimerase [Rubripirellula obstinata]|uniref:UDP-glucose 4-epimerase n=1 Tax=Rubripirellula obstinata TaxID=406547 RepID=A0A5B1CBT9_9BACT|nr:UDP-glucose 4-epimerase GalE [Rubripirellula obstinata]KAA1257682.1 UDP-glucose 4-epimerase [Rubripirellula obstinata]